jgi:hypothetical protein
MFSNQTDDFFDRPVKTPTRAATSWLALLPGFLLIAWALLRAF